MYKGYRIRLATTGPLSNSEQVRPKRFAATPTARPHGPAPITATSSVTSRHLDDLVAAGGGAHVLDGRVGQVLEHVEIRTRRGRKVRAEVAPNSPPSVRMRSASFASASVGSGPFPTRVV